MLTNEWQNKAALILKKYQDIKKVTKNKELIDVYELLHQRVSSYYEIYRDSDDEQDNAIKKNLSDLEKSYKIIKIHASDILECIPEDVKDAYERQEEIISILEEACQNYTTLLEEDLDRARNYFFKNPQAAYLSSLKFYWRVDAATIPANSQDTTESVTTSESGSENSNPNSPSGNKKRMRIK